MRKRTLILVAAFGLSCTALLHAEPLMSSAGIGTIVHPLQEPEKVAMPSCYDKGNCRCCKEKVHIFGVNGFNPLCLGNFNGMLNYFHSQGFEHTYFAQFYTCYWFASKIRDIRSADPDAKIALVGFSLGANYVRSIAHSLEKEGVTIDLLVYLVGDMVGNTESSHPPNVGRILNIRGQGMILAGGDLLVPGSDIDGACNERINCRHILAPSRRETLEVMTRELLMLACFPETTPEK